MDETQPLIQKYDDYGEGSSSGQSKWVHYLVDYGLFSILLLAVLGTGGICIFLSTVLIDRGPWWQIAQYINTIYPVFTVLVLAFWALWFFRGPCAPLRDSNARLKRVFLSAPGALLLFYVVFVLCWSVPVCLFLYNYNFDNNENMSILRLGAVSHNGFSAFATQPGAKSLQVQYRLKGQANWQNGSTTAGNAATFWVDGLQHSKQYELRVLTSGNIGPASFSSTVRTAPLPGTHGVTSFVWGSCWNGNMQQGPVKFPAFHDNFDSWQKVASLNPDFVLFIGDFIYVDHPHYIDQTPEAYAIRYRQAFSEQSFQNNARSLPSLYMYDDHEIVDNWDGYDVLDTGGKKVCFESYRCFNSSTMYLSGIQMYRKYLGDTNPPTKWNTTSLQSPDVELFFDYTYGDNAFFVADNRGFRSINTVAYGSPTKNFLGPAQLQAVFSWLLANNNTAVFKFLMIPGSFTNFINPAKLDWSTGGGDDGYSVFPVEREKLITFIQTNHIHNVFILTGDVHVPFAIKIRDGLYEFSSSPMGGFAAQDIAFDSEKPWKLDHPDSAYEWSDESYVNYFGNGASYISRAIVNSTARPATLQIDYFKSPDLTTPLYTRHFTEV